MNEFYDVPETHPYPNKKTKTTKVTCDICSNVLQKKQMVAHMREHIGLNKVSTDSYLCIFIKLGLV